MWAASAALDGVSRVEVNVGEAALEISPDEAASLPGELVAG